MATEEEDSIEGAAATRRQRLRALRAAQELLNTPDQDDLPHHHAAPAPPPGPPDRDADNDDEKEEEEEGQEEREDNVNMKFRNYLPHDKQLQEGRVAPPVLPKFEDPVAEAPPCQEKKEDPFLNIAPKKPNWDLRRDVQKKLDKLEKRTQKAMFQLMAEEEKRRRLSEEGADGED
ncbi:coiled-coil domain-containing protein 12 [Coffea eugenioides]|uniref:Coiled-coil domain-containing protein 12-like n=1 Tax=Coffea arabica TaxID=13443 RepID=A0A6P6XDA7_COFAR|nr:coiled-coil domain-containing protein 12-like [Coffea arabica]XP_027124851.1 coiled-coil domain-containing protein 12-like [Coffea arabica]XP_027168170.1 coiled-coil domain-containing protein 12 [Coffea eugenioides]